MRITDDLRKTVVFFGFPGPEEQGGITCIGTGFFLSYEDTGYLITAKHLARMLGGDPFLLRINKKDGTAMNIPVDGAVWAEHPRVDVDVAAVPLSFGISGALDVMYLPDAKLLINSRIEKEYVGIGDLTYTIGLFRFMHGRRRNLPIVHFGSIAAMPGDELIPVRDWNFTHENRRAWIEGYLVETQAMQGLSGSPVFVRPTYGMGLRDDNSGKQKAVYTMRQETFLLGLWQGSWDAKPDEILAAQAGENVRVPVGMGVVIPASKIEETLQTMGLRFMREQDKKEREERESRGAAKSDAVPIARVAPDAPRASDANPNHREDFKSLLGEAARKRESED